jgi:ATP-dependent Clp protease ATP-binding subunit ClpC
MSTARERTARTHVLVDEQLDGHCLVHPVTDPRLAAYGREEDALTEITLFLREHFAHAPPQAKSRLSLPSGAALLDVAVPLPRDEAQHKKEGDDVPVTFACVVVPARAGSTTPPTSPEHDDVWVLVPVLDHAFYVTRGEPLEEAARAEIRRLLGAEDRSPWEIVGLLPPRAHRLEVLEIPLSDEAHADAEARHRRLAERARKKQAERTLFQVASPLPKDGAPPLVGRDAELSSLGALLDGKDRLGVLLVGQEQAGKSALVRAYAAVSSRRVWSTSGAELIAGMSGLGEWQQRIRDVMDAVEELDGVLYFETLDDLLADRVEDGGIDFASAMRPWLDQGKVRIVAEIRSDRLDAVEGRHWAFFAGLSRIRVEPLSAADTRIALARLAAHDARVAPERPRVAEEAIAPLVDLAERYLPYAAFPGKAVRLYQDLRAAHESDSLGSNEPVTLGKRDLYQVFSIATGVPEFLLRDDATLRVEDVAAALRRHVIGQEEAIKRLSETIGVVKAGLAPSGKPLATFLFIGPTGVGKTELSRALAAYLFGSPDRMVRFDMSEFMTPDAAERLIRGSESADGLLTRRVREQPFCVLLLDEIEKAHPAVFDLLLQVCGEGRLTDARGRTAYFHNAILIMTSNLGATERRTPAGFTSGPTADMAHYQRLVQVSFRQEFVNRIDRIVPFRPLSRGEVLEVTRLGVTRLAQRAGLGDTGSTLAASEAALGRLAEDGYSVLFGARAQRRHLDEHLAGPLARLCAGLGGEARDLTIDVTLAGEPDPDREGVVAASAEAGALRLTARRRKRAKEAAGAHDHASVADIRRAVDRHMALGPVEQLRDQIDFLLAQLNLTEKEKRDSRVQRELGELSAEHHRLSELWKKLVAAQEEVHAVEEIAILSLFEGQPVDALAADAQKAHAAFLHTLPYALLALEPKRDAVTLLVEELDDGALAAWLHPFLETLPGRGWSVLAHPLAQQDDKPRPGEPVDETWPADRPWGPARTAEQIARDLVERPAAMRCLLLRVKGPYAGVLLALEKGLHRRIPAKSGQSTVPEEDRKLHLMIRTLALRFDVPADAWKEPHLAPPPIGSAATRKRGQAARVWDEVEGKVEIPRFCTLSVDPAAYWVRLEEIAVEMLLLFESGALDRDDYFTPALEAE